MIVTSYTNADLDGVACIVGYSELLEKKGKEAKPVVFGSPHKEAKYVMDQFDIDLDSGEKADLEGRDVFLLDTSDPSHIPEEVNPGQVRGIIDHRKDHEAEKFENAEAQIELVGAAATLVAEKFRDREVEISDESANLLYAAIVSNTLNFKANTTTPRDEKMHDWLEQNANVEESVTEKMFEVKSEIEEPLKQVFLGDKKIRTWGGKSFFIGQLEIIDAEEFVETRKQDILKALDQIREEKSMDHSFLTVADLEEGFNLVVAGAQDTQEILGEALDLEFRNSVGKRSEVLLRKEMEPRIRSVMEYSR